MVTIIDYAVRLSSKGDPFISLKLQGDLEMVKSKDSGRFYATARKCSITSTFTEEVAKNLIGKMIPGNIHKLNCENYEYTIPETGEQITLDYSFVFTPEEEKPAKVQMLKPIVFSSNGVFAEA